MLAAASRAEAQPAIANRVVAIPGNNPDLGKPVWEPELAAGANRVLAVCNYGSRGGTNGGGYGLCKKLTGTGGPGWVWQTLSNEQIPKYSSTSNEIDFSAAYNTVSGQYLVVTNTLDGSSKHLIVAALSSDVFGSWNVLYTDSVYDIDKPYIIRGTMSSSPSVQEFYIVWLTEEGQQYRYLRTKDGGANWSGDVVKVAGVAVPGTYSIQPSYASASTIYAAYTIFLPRRIGLLMGTDDDDAGDGDPAGLVDWSYLESSADVKQQITLRKRGPELEPFIPGDIATNIKSLGMIAADPTNADRVFVIYHDVTTEANSADVDVFCAILTRSGGYWTISSTTRVNTDANPSGGDNDQFSPAACIDTEGRIHVVFLDDRDFTQADTEEFPSFNAYYAVSYDAGATWSNHKLRDAADTPALVEQQWNNGSGEIGEYMGIAEYNGTVWAVFPGTLPTTNEVDHESVIWAARIVP